MVHHQPTPVVAIPTGYPMPLPQLFVTARVSPAVGSTYLAEAIAAVHRAEGYPSAVIEAEGLVTLDAVRSEIAAVLDATPRPSAVVLDLGRRWQEVVRLLGAEDSSPLFARVERCTVCLVTNGIQAFHGSASELLSKLGDTTVTTVGGAKPIQFVELINRHRDRNGDDLAFRLVKHHLSATLTATSLTLPTSLWWQGSAEDLFHAAQSSLDVFTAMFARKLARDHLPPFDLKRQWFAVRASAAVLADALAAADLTPYGFSRRLFPAIPYPDADAANGQPLALAVASPCGLSGTGTTAVDPGFSRGDADVASRRCSGPS